MTNDPHRHSTTEPNGATTDKPSYYRLHKAACDSSHNKWLSKPENRARWNAYMRERRRHAK